MELSYVLVWKRVFSCFMQELKTRLISGLMKFVYSGFMVYKN